MDHNFNSSLPRCLGVVVKNKALSSINSQPLIILQNALHHFSLLCSHRPHKRTNLLYPFSYRRRHPYRSELRAWWHHVRSWRVMLRHELRATTNLRQFPSVLHEQPAMRLQHLQQWPLQRLHCLVIAERVAHANWRRRARRKQLLPWRHDVCAGSAVLCYQLDATDRLR
jgi:hypothetical protein